MALLDDVKSELAAIDNELPIAKKAQATAMIRFGNGLHSVDHHILVQAQLDSQDAAIWLQDTIRNLYGHEATLTPVSRQTPTGVVQRFIVRVPKGSAALVLQTGLYSRYTKNMVLGLPGDIINGKIAQIKAAWRGAFLAGGHLSDPGKASYLEIVCPNHEAALALVSTARRLGITAKPRKLRSSERVTLRDPDAIERMLILMGAPHSAREWTGKRSDGEARGKANRLANFDDANMRRSAKAPRKPAIRSARPLKSSATTFRTILNPPASSDSTMPTRPLSSWAVSPTRQSPRTRSPDVSVDCCNWLRKRRRHAVKRLDFRFRKQNTMRLFRRMVFLFVWACIMRKWQYGHSTLTSG